MSRTKNFSIDEDAYIRNNYRNLFDEEIAEVLNRPVGSITRRRQRLGCWHVQQEVSASVGGEIWVQIKDLPSGYMVSNMGRIKSGNKLCTLYIRKVDMYNGGQYRCPLVMQELIKSIVWLQNTFVKQINVLQSAMCTILMETLKTMQLTISNGYFHQSIN